MKKQLMIALAVGLGFAVSVNAQENNPDKIKFGIKAGGNLTTLGKISDGTNSYTYDYKPGFTAGIFSEIPLGSDFMFVPELNYSQKGANVENTVQGIKTEFKQRVNYLDVPLAFSYMASPGLSIFAGPQVSFFLDQKSEAFVDGQKTAENSDSKDIAKTIAAGVVGLGYNLSPNLGVKGRYMMDFQKGSSSDDPNLKDIKNSGFSLTLGYKF